MARLTARSCVASSSRRERLDFSLAIAGLAHAFGDRVYSADQVTRAKPAPDLFLHAAERMGAAPSRSLVIEDSVNGKSVLQASLVRTALFVAVALYAWATIYALERWRNVRLRQRAFLAPPFSEHGP